MISFSSIQELSASAPHLIDVRAPIEFSKGALPGAVNLPILNNDERDRVGTCYKQHGQDAAIAMGTELVSGTLKADRVQAWGDYLAQHPNSVVYCFRGGLRSRTAKAWLSEAGVSCEILQGGYKAMRQLFMEELVHATDALPMVLVGGRTGTGKTSLLSKLPASIDLEGLARHRGSSFGATLEPQPSNIDFEHSLTLEYSRCLQIDSNRVFLEDEARMVGRVCIPEVVRNKMEVAPLVILEVSMQERVRNVIKDYIEDLLAMYQARDGEEPGFDAFLQHHQSSLDRVKKRLGGANYQLVRRYLSEAAAELRAEGDAEVFAPYVQTLLDRYYDPMYDYQLEKKQARVKFVGNGADILAWCNNAQNLGGSRIS